MIVFIIGVVVGAAALWAVEKWLLKDLPTKLDPTAKTDSTKTGI